MADNDEMFADEGGGDVGAKSPKLIPGLIMTILKWVGLSLLLIIFIVTVVVITFNIVNRGNKNQSIAAVSPDYQGKSPEWEWYDAIPEVRAITSDPTPYTVVVTVALGYDVKNKTLSTEMGKRTQQFQDLIRQFFSSKLYAELSPTRETELKNELRDKINRILNSGKIHEVVFTDYTIIQF